MNKIKILFFLVISLNFETLDAQELPTFTNPNNIGHLKCFVVINSQPPGAEIFLEDSLVGYTPLQLLLPNDSIYHLRISLEKFQEWKKTISINHQDTLIIEANLLSMYGALSIFSSGEDIDILINDSLIIHDNKFAKLFLAGKYSIRIQDTATNRFVTEDVFIAPGTQIFLQSRLGFYSLKPLSMSLLIPGSGQIYDRAYVEGAMYALGFFTGLYLAASSNNTYQQRLNEYYVVRKNYLGASNESEASTRNQEMQISYETMDNAFVKRQVAIFFTAGVYVLNLVNVYLFHSVDDELIFMPEKSKQKYSPFVSMTNNSSIIGLHVRF